MDKAAKLASAKVAVVEEHGSKNTIKDEAKAHFVIAWCTSTFKCTNNNNNINNMIIIIIVT